MKIPVIAVMKVLAALVALGLAVPGGAGFVLAQIPNYMLPDKKEKPKETKPPGALEPGPQGTSKHGWGAVQKSPGGKGSQDLGWPRPKPLGHDTPSKPKNPAKLVPQETKTPKSPPQPKTPKSTPEMDFSAPDPAKTPLMPAAPSGTGFTTKE
uniref:Uncharacterized protein n=1 Tax=Desulfobacca acetoxidans TaxID=60893 RepID=A0A7V4G7P1_9BACT